MPEERDLYAKKHYVLSVDQLIRIKDLIYENDWKGPLKQAEMGILATNMIIAEDIVYKFYPEEEDAGLKNGLLKDLADFLGVIKDDAGFLCESAGLDILNERVRVLEIFLENNRKTAT